MLRREFISRNTYVRKEVISQINIVSFRLTDHKKEELIKHKASRKKKIID